MVAWTCGWCRETASFRQIGQPFRCPDRTDTSEEQIDTAYRCELCNGITAKRTYQPRWSPLYDADPDSYQIIEGPTFPPPASHRNYRDVPPDIASAASEAWRCFSMGANRGALALARAVIESTAKDRGIVDGNLYSKIEALAARNLIRPGVKDAAHEIRWSGNDVAHGDLARVIDVEESEEILDIMDDVLEEVYHIPARADRRRAAREARKARATP